MFRTQHLYQNDPQWKSVPLGFATETIGGWGCLLTSVTMMLNGLGYNETPVTVNDKMKAAGGFQGAFFIPSALPYVFPNVSYNGMQPCETVPAPIPLIDANLAAGKPTILQVDWNPDAGIQTHFVLLKDKKDEDYVLYDPYMYRGDSPDKEILLTQRYKYQGTNLASAITGVLWFDGTVPPAPPEKTHLPVPAERFVVYAAEDDLALRAEGAVTGYLWKRMVAGSELICLEEKAKVQAKIGQQGKWIQVQDPAGDQGFVAAWYVALQKGAPPAASTPTAATTTTPTTSTARRTTTPATQPAAPAAPAAPLPAGALALVPTEEVAFRTQPQITPATLIRRVPVTEQLVAVEPSAQVIAKVGKENQWLKVRDNTNREGYVAAWYVKYASGSTATAAATTTPPAPAGTLKVKTTAELVALRSQPVVSDNTLIKRFPLGTELTVTEANAQSKIGANNQWIKVKDAGGAEGVVAAWFVSL